MPTREIIAPTRRERVVNWGQTQSVVGPTKASILQLDEEQSSDLVLTVEVTQLSLPADVEGDIRPYVRVDWGHGGIDVSQEFEATRRQRIPIPGSKAVVSGYLKSLAVAQDDGSEIVSAIPASCTATFRAFVAQHTDALPLAPTYWLLQMGTNVGNLVGPAGLTPPAVQLGQQVRLVTLRAWNYELFDGGSGLTFLQLFDQATVPVNGDLPIDAFPLVGSEEPGLTQVLPDAYRFTHAFARGLAWAISSTPFSLTLDPDASAFVKVELLH